MVSLLPTKVRVKILKLGRISRPQHIASQVLPLDQTALLKTFRDRTDRTNRSDLEKQLRLEAKAVCRRLERHNQAKLFFLLTT